MSDVYKPKALRKPHLDVREIRYAIGISSEDCENFGMVFGPVKDIEECLDEIGQVDAHILRFNTDGTTDVIWSWNDDDEQWEKFRG